MSSSQPGSSQPKLSSKPKPPSRVRAPVSARTNNSPVVTAGQEEGKGCRGTSGQMLKQAVECYSRLSLPEDHRLFQEIGLDIDFYAVHLAPTYSSTALVVTRDGICIISSLGRTPWLSASLDPPPGGCQRLHQMNTVRNSFSVRAT